MWLGTDFYLFTIDTTTIFECRNQNYHFKTVTNWDSNRVDISPSKRPAVQSRQCQRTAAECKCQESEPRRDWAGDNWRWIPLHCSTLPLVQPSLPSTPTIHTDTQQLWWFTVNSSLVNCGPVDLWCNIIYWQFMQQLMCSTPEDFSPTYLHRLIVSKWSHL